MLFEFSTLGVNMSSDIVSMSHLVDPPVHSVCLAQRCDKSEGEGQRFEGHLPQMLYRVCVCM